MQPLGFQPIALPLSYQTNLVEVSEEGGPRHPELPVLRADLANPLNTVTPRVPHTDLQ